MDNLNCDSFIIMERALRQYIFYLREDMENFCDKYSAQVELVLAESVLAAVVECLMKKEK